MDNCVSREEFNDVKEDVDNLFNKTNKHDRQISVLETLVENLKGLPSAINSLEKTMALMGQNLESLNDKVDKVVDDAEKQDEKSKIDILEAFKSHWWGIVMTLALIATWVQNYFAN